ncbi:hypothetical protein E2562_003707 [Oryza meyeriana var. granulata]|uniref:Uncharacterized protein n=1 Tax=Oryza meyeriana var. granulata TaxID=110450 RepID=A0A6G1C5J9_9ORYZ|nr:hypothetical protein E2562_003707 [Oryza meyeriana var. granulata]
MSSIRCLGHQDEGMLEAISVQALAQAHYCLSGCDTSDSCGKKLLLFLKWKCMEAKISFPMCWGVLVVCFKNITPVLISTPIGTTGRVR